MAEKHEKHQFALAVKDLQQWASPELQHRLQHVLRLSVGVEIILFDHDYHQTAIVRAVDRKGVQLELSSAIQPNPSWQPKIVVGVPLLKRAALETVLYNCVELGANQIQLIETAKSERSKLVRPQLERWERVLLAAAEQSKNFGWPILCSPVKLSEFLQQVALVNNKICFDVAGQPLITILSGAKSQAATTTILAGPEADFTAEEKKMLTAAGFQFCALTPTILRASQALSLGLGIWRSYFRCD